MKTGIIVALVDNSAARSLVAMLPLDLEFRDYAGSEKISDLQRKLDNTDVPDGHDPSLGDLTPLEAVTAAPDAICVVTEKRTVFVFGER